MSGIKSLKGDTVFTGWFDSPSLMAVLVSNVDVLNRRLPAGRPIQGNGLAIWKGRCAAEPGFCLPLLRHTCPCPHQSYGRRHSEGCTGTVMS